MTVKNDSKPVTVPLVIARGFLGRCPNCGSKTLFASWFKTHDQCSDCGLVFERDEGFFLGAMVVNYTFTGLLLVPVLIAAITHALTMFQAVAVAIAVAVLFPLLFYPASKTLWLAVWYTLFPGDLPANGADETH